MLINVGCVFFVTHWDVYQHMTEFTTGHSRLHLETALSDLAAALSDLAPVNFRWENRARASPEESDSVGNFVCLFTGKPCKAAKQPEIAVGKTHLFGHEARLENQCWIVRVYDEMQICSVDTTGCFLKWWYPQNTPK